MLPIPKHLTTPLTLTTELGALQSLKKAIEVIHIGCGHDSCVATVPRGHFGWQKLYECTGGSIYYD